MRTDTISILSPNQQIIISRFIGRVYGWMSVGLLVTAATAFMAVQSQGFMESLLNSRGLFFFLIILELGLVFGLSALARKISPMQALMGFMAFSLVNGLTLSAVFIIYTYSSIFQVFLVTAGMFGGMAIFGAVTKRDLTGVGSFLIMGVWGLILVGVVNMFLGSTSLHLGLSVAGVIIFAGLAAYDSQRIKQMALVWANNEGGVNSREAGVSTVMAALTMYLNFINLFFMLLRLMGDRK